MRRQEVRDTQKIITEYFAKNEVTNGNTPSPMSPTNSIGSQVRYFGCAIRQSLCYNLKCWCILFRAPVRVNRRAKWYRSRCTVPFSGRAATLTTSPVVMICGNKRTNWWTKATTPVSVCFVSRISTFVLLFYYLIKRNQTTITNVLFFRILYSLRSWERTDHIAQFTVNRGDLRQGWPSKAQIEPQRNCTIDDRPIAVITENVVINAHSSGLSSALTFVAVN